MRNVRVAVPTSAGWSHEGTKALRHQGSKARSLRGRAALGWMASWRDFERPSYEKSSLVRTVDGRPAARVVFCVPMHEFVSEWIQPRGGAFDTQAMGAGTSGLPRAFAWRVETFEVAETLGAWKESGPEVGRLHGERYLRRHYWRLRMADGAVWTVYFVRHTPRGGSAKRRWFLYDVEHGEPG